MSDIIVETIAELSRAFNVSRHTIYAWKEKGMPIEEDGCFDVRKVGRWRGKRINKSWLDKNRIYPAQKAEIVALTENTDKTPEEIGKMTGISVPAVKKLQRYIREHSGVADYVKEHKADLLSVEQGRNHLIRDEIMRSIEGNTDEFKDLSLKDKVDIYKSLGLDSSNLFKDERLERGESTENVSIVISAIKDAKRRRDGADSRAD